MKCRLRVLDSHVGNIEEETKITLYEKRLVDSYYSIYTGKQKERKALLRHRKKLHVWINSRLKMCVNLELIYIKKLCLNFKLEKFNS